MIQVQCAEGEDPFFVPKSLVIPRSKFFAEECNDRPWDVPVDVSSHSRGGGEENFEAYLELLYTGDVEYPGATDAAGWRAIVDLYIMAGRLKDSKSVNMVLDKIVEALQEYGLCSAMIDSIYDGVDLQSNLSRLLVDFTTTCMTLESLEDFFDSHPQPLYLSEFLQLAALEFLRQRDERGNPAQERFEGIEKYYMNY